MNVKFMVNNYANITDELKTKLMKNFSIYSLDNKEYGSYCSAYNFDKLGKEIYDYTKYIVSESDKKNKDRIKTQTILENIIANNENNLKVDIYGSFPQELSTEDSDIDFIINLANEIIKEVNFRLLDKQKEINGLKYIKFILENNKFTNKIYLLY